MKLQPNILVFSTGTATGGGGGFENLYHATEAEILEANIAAVICNIRGGGVEEKANRLKIPFVHFAGPYTAEGYADAVGRAAEVVGLGKHDFFDLICLSGWLRMTHGLSPKRTINIHPCIMPSNEFAGGGKWGHHTHEAALKAFHERRITHTAVSMHFVEDGPYDSGPRFISYPVEIHQEDTVETLAARVNRAEHFIQPLATNWVLKGFVRWISNGRVFVPDWVPNQDIPVSSQAKLEL